jgi:hypothetical protein
VSALVGAVAVAFVFVPLAVGVLVGVVDGEFRLLAALAVGVLVGVVDGEFRLLAALAVGVLVGAVAVAFVFVPLAVGVLVGVVDGEFRLLAALAVGVLVGAVAVAFVFVPLAVGVLVGVVAVAFVFVPLAVGMGFIAGLLSNVTPFKVKVMCLVFESVKGGWGTVELGTWLLTFDTIKPKGSVTPVVPKPVRFNWYLAQLLVNVTFLLMTANFMFEKICGLFAGVLEGLPIATKATFSPPNSPFAKKTTLCTPVRSSV